MTDEIKQRNRTQRQLTTAARDLVKKAEKLETCLERLETDRTLARVALSEFNATLRLIARIAKAKLDGEQFYSGNGQQ